MSLDFIPDDTTACGLLGCGTIGLDISRFDNLSAEQIVQLGVSFIFVSIIAIGIFLTIKGALKIMRSEGDSGKVEEGSKIIKGVLIGIAMIFVGIVGIVLVLAFFDAGGIANVDPQEPDGIDFPLTE